MRNALCFCVLLRQELQMVHPVSTLENVAMLGCSKFTSIQLLHLTEIMCSAINIYFFLLLLIHSTPFQLIK